MNFSIRSLTQSLKGGTMLFRIPILAEFKTKFTTVKIKENADWVNNCIDFIDEQINKIEAKFTLDSKAKPNVYSRKPHTPLYMRNRPTR